MPLINYYRRQRVETLLRIARAVRADAAQTRNVYQSPAASLYYLPVELICEICEQLSLAETFCLMICCARFWHSRRSIPIFTQVQRQLSYPPPHLNEKLRLPYRHDIAEMQFHIVRLIELDRFGGKGTSHLCCWACMRTHRKRCFPNPAQPVNLKLSIQEQRITCLGASRIRSCESKCRRIWVGLCYEISFAELRCLQYGTMYCEGGSYIDIFPANGGKHRFDMGFKHIQLNLSTQRIEYWFILGRLSDFPRGLEDFDNLCRLAEIPICRHTRIEWFAGRFLRSLKPGERWVCSWCRTRFYIQFEDDGFVEVHVSCEIGMLYGITSGVLDQFYKASYGSFNHDLVRHGRTLAKWLDKMYDPESGRVWNRGRFEMFEPTRRPDYYFDLY